MRALSTVLKRDVEPCVFSMVSLFDTITNNQDSISFEMSSTLKKRRKMMNKHKLKKRKKRDRYKNK